MKKDRKNATPDKAGGSIQDRINEMRRRQARRSGDPGRSQFRQNKPPEPAPGVVDETDTALDEAFLRHFEEEMRRKTRRADSMTDLLRERAREGREHIREAHKSPMTPRKSPAAGGGEREPAPASSRTSKPQSNGVNSQHQFPPEGSILRISDTEIAIFHRDVPGKNYQLVYMVNADGTLSPQGIYLPGYEYEEIGLVPPGLLAEMEKDLLWSRDSLVFHLDRFEHVSLIPHPKSGAAAKSVSSPDLAQTPLGAPQPAAPDDSLPATDQPLAPESTRPQGQPIEVTPDAQLPFEQRLYRGRWLRVDMGKNRSWDAVFWGKDQLGMVVAHKTSGAWTLMHLDLTRFGDSVSLNGALDEGEMRELEECLRRNYA